jgi:3'(2'), 5'-bisphosphate nucleotidase
VPPDAAPEGPNGASPDDHRLAADLAHATGRLLVDLRERLVADGASPERIRAEGDRRANALLLDALAERAPGDAVLSEEAEGSHDTATRERLDAERLWVVDPLDGTNEYGDPARGDWGVHVALVIRHQPVAAAVTLPAQRFLFTTDPPPAPPPPGPVVPRILVSRTRRPAFVDALADRLGGVVNQMGSAGAKAMSVVLGAADVYVHDSGMYEWDSAAPVAVARAAGLHTSRLDGTPLAYNNPEPRMPDLLICRPEWAPRVLATLPDLAR